MSATQGYRVSGVGYGVWALVAALVCSSAVCEAQGGGAARGGGGGGGGGRGGRGAIRVMTLTSSAMKDGAHMPPRFTQAGVEVSPPLEWSGAPDTVASYVLVVHDIDAPTANGLDDALHWLVWNIPGTARSQTEGVPQGPQLADGTRQISVTGPNYRGPAAPITGPPHHYVFELYALDTMIDVPAVGASPAATRAAVVAAMSGHIRAKGVFVALFRRE